MFYCELEVFICDFFDIYLLYKTFLDFLWTNWKASLYFLAILDSFSVQLQTFVRSLLDATKL